MLGHEANIAKDKSVFRRNTESTPCATARLCLNIHTQDIENFSFKSVKLVQG